MNLPNLRHDPFPVEEPYHGIYAHGVETQTATRHLYISGQTPESPSGALATDFDSQCRQAIQNLFDVLKSADMEPQHLIKMNFYLTRKQDMPGLIEVRKDLLDGIRPAITTVFVAGLVSDDWLVEVDAVAAADSPHAGFKRGGMW